MTYNENIHEKYVYVVFSATNLRMAKMIRLVTRNTFNHVSLAFDEDLHVMYSFARYHMNSPLVGGFVTEYPNRFLAENKDVYIKICKVRVSGKRYEEIENMIFGFLQRKNEMVYNSFNAIFSLFHKKVHIDNAYTCVEFITSIFDLENITSVKELEAELEGDHIYSGCLKKIPSSDSEKDDYFTEQCFLGIIWDTLSHFRILLLRVIN